MNYIHHPGACIFSLQCEVCTRISGRRMPETHAPGSTQFRVKWRGIKLKQSLQEAESSATNLQNLSPLPLSCFCNYISPSFSLFLECCAELSYVWPGAAPQWRKGRFRFSGLARGERGVRSWRERERERHGVNECDPISDWKGRLLLWIIYYFGMLICIRMLTSETEEWIFNL